MAALTYSNGSSACRRAGPRRSGAINLSVLAAADIVLRPVPISVAIVVAATVWSTPTAQAEPVDSSYTSVLSSIGIGNNGPLSTAIAQVGQSICPLLVQPGSSVASSALEAGGNGGLVSTVGGAVTGMVIESQCPNAMTQLSNGDVGPLLQLLGMNNASSAFGLPGTAATSSLTEIPSAATNPLQLAGLS